MGPAERRLLGLGWRGGFARLSCLASLFTPECHGTPRDWQSGSAQQLLWGLPFLCPVCSLMRVEGYVCEWWHGLLGEARGVVCVIAGAFVFPLLWLTSDLWGNGLPRWHSGKKIHLPVQETQETWAQSLGREDPLEEELTTHSSILAWEIPWTEEPGGLLSMESQTLSDWPCTHAVGK